MDCPAGHFVTIVCAEYQYQQAAHGSRLILWLHDWMDTKLKMIESEIDFDYLLAIIDGFPRLLIFIVHDCKICRLNRFKMAILEIEHTIRRIGL